MQRTAGGGGDVLTTRAAPSLEVSAGQPVDVDLESLRLTHASEGTGPLQVVNRPRPGEVVASRCCWHQRDREDRRTVVPTTGHERSALMAQSEGEGALNGDEAGPEHAVGLTINAAIAALLAEGPCERLATADQRSG